MRVFYLFPVLAGVLAAQTLSYSYDAAGRLTSVTYPSGKVLTYLYDASGNVMQRSVMDPGAAPSPMITGAAGPVAPAAALLITGTGLGPAVEVRNVPNRRGVLAAAAGQTTVLFDGVPGTVVYASTSETCVIVPASVTGKKTTRLVLWHRGKSSSARELPVAAVPDAPAVPKQDADPASPGSRCG
jgi:YD repeat-containing protein